MRINAQRRIEKLMEEQRRIKAELRAIQSNTGASAKAKAIRALLKQMRKEGITLEELQQAFSTSVKYAHPLTGETWAGKGRKPLWLEEELSRGRSLDDFLVQ